jgi:hypothetical protein
MTTIEALTFIKRALASVGTTEWQVRETLVDAVRVIENELAKNADKVAIAPSAPKPQK